MKIQQGFSRQDGATLTEFAMVASFVFVPMIVLTMLMGKQIQAKHHYEQALRYAAFERTVWFAQQPKHRPPGVTVPVKSDVEIGREIQARMLSDRNALIKSNHRTGQVAEKMDPILYWKDYQSQTYKPRLAKLSQANNAEYVKNTENNEKVPGVAGNGVDATIDVLKGLTGFSVQTNGLYRSKVTMDLTDIDWIKEFKSQNNQALDLRVDRSVQNNVSNKERQLMLLADGWNMGGRESTKSQVKSLVLTSLLDNAAIRTAQSIAGWIPFAKELGPNYLELGKVDPDVVPSHRLGNFPR
ncbi:MAG TPA: TadE family protein [Burkholderiales bacterium]|nr:TadE family protein [Burkholderiales bacterium]